MMMHDGLQEFTVQPGGQSGLKEYCDFMRFVCRVNHISHSFTKLPHGSQTTTVLDKKRWAFRPSHLGILLMTA